MFPTHRPRRLRGSSPLRAMLRETTLAPEQLVAPLFVQEGLNGSTPIASMPGQSRHGLDSLVAEAEACAEAGVGGLLLFGLPEHKDPQGSGAWAEDGIFPNFVKRIHPQRQTPQVAILLSGAMATAAIAGSHLAGDFFLGVDILVTAMLVNFLLVCLSAAWISSRNPTLADAIQVVRSSALRAAIGISGAALMGIYLAVHLWKDLRAPVDAWYLRSTWLWVLVMIAGSLVFATKWRAIAADPARRRLFDDLPAE